MKKINIVNYFYKLIKIRIDDIYKNNSTISNKINLFDIVE